MEFVPDESGPLRLTTLDADDNAFYVVGADPASGVGKDYSTAHIITYDEEERIQIIGYYHSNTTPPTEFAADLDKIGRYFRGRQWAALLAVENQGAQGSLPINELHKHLNYPNAYMHQMVGTKTKNKTRMFEFPMTQDRRKSSIDRLAQYLAFDAGVCRIDGIYPLLRQELGQFVMQETANGNVRYAADTGCHDDLVMSLAISLWVLVEEYHLASPVPATIEDNTWRSTGRISLKSMREARNRAIDDMEEANRQQWETFQIGSDFIR